MNQGKIWCVVNPTVGLPLFLGSVAVTSLIVHYAILSHTPWFSNYWTGGHGKVASADGIGAVASVQAEPGFVVSVAPISGTGTQTSFLVTVAPSAARNAEVASAADVTTRTPETVSTSTQ